MSQRTVPFAWIVGAILGMHSLAGCGGGGEESPIAPAAPVPLPSAPATGSCPLGLATGDLVPSANTAPVCDAQSYDTHTDVVYTAHAAGLLDLLVPRNATAPLPLVVWVHGGGWQSGDKTNREQAQRLVCRGFALAAINYRLSDSAVFPAQIQDVKAAIRFLRANASTYRLDPARIALFGSSAGGHLAALGGTSDLAEFEDPLLGNAGVSSRVQAVVDWYGPTRFVDMDTQLLAQGCPAGSARHSAADSPESRLLGCTVGDASCADAARRADPARYVDATDPPHLLMHGTRDCTVPAGQSTLLDDALAGAGACVVRRTVQDAGHGGTPWLSVEVQEATARFLEQVFARPTASAVTVNCGAWRIDGDPTAAGGASWTYRSTDAGTEYDLTGALFAPAGAGPFGAVVVSHGAGGNAAGYSSNVARTMRDWGLVAIATNYTHAPDGVDAGRLPQGGDGASDANVARAHKARDLLSCMAGVDMARLAAHGHSMGAFVTGQLLGVYPGDFRAASHSAGGANDTGPNATRASVAAAIRTPYQLHHGDADVVVDVALDRALDSILATSGTAHELVVYPGFTHEQIALDATMLARVREWYRLHGVL